MKILYENSLLYEVTQNDALETLVTQLKELIPTSNGNHTIDIFINKPRQCVEIHFKNSNVSYYVVPKLIGKSNKQSTHTVPVSHLDGAVIKNNIVYDSNGIKLGSALVRLPKNYQRDDYSSDLQDAEMLSANGVTSINKLLKKIGTDIVGNRNLNK